jgi:hypothetical protein
MFKAATGMAMAGSLLGLTGLLLTARSEAQPPAPATFCEVYPNAPACAGGEVDCATCHETPPALNPYGEDVSLALAPGEIRPLSADTFAAHLPAALSEVERLDSDGDGFGNRAEILAGSSPAKAADSPPNERCRDEDEDGWNLCGYDFAYAYKKVMLDFCGRSPTWTERNAFLQRAKPYAALHETLDTCLESEYWQGKGGRVWNLGNKKIGPQQAIKSGKGVGPIPLADYDDDYAYFVWTQTGERDARLALTGTTFVSAEWKDGRTVYTEWDRTPEEDRQLRGYDRYQAVEKEHRAGLLTHRWFLMSNVMFTPVPRTAAAQAYRAYLGHDIAFLEGLHPIANEPMDFDNKGVQASACASCHSTLDALTYPFSRYEGIGGGSVFAEPYSYNPNRMQGFIRTEGQDIALVPEEGHLFGEPVANLVEWAEIAANSPDFRRAVVLDYWRMLLGEVPRPNEQAEFSNLTEEFGSVHDYNVPSMLHALIDTEAYGAP